MAKLRDVEGKYATGAVRGQTLYLVDRASVSCGASPGAVNSLFTGFHQLSVLKRKGANTQASPPEPVYIQAHTGDIATDRDPLVEMGMFLRSSRLEPHEQKGKLSITYRRVLVIRLNQ